jgi:O-methyltransferase domain/Dimerisation domain
LAGGFSATQILNTAAKLRIADHLAAKPRSAADLAEAIDAHPQALHRFLRMLAALQLVTERSNGCFGLSSLGQFLRSDHPESVRDRIIYIGEIGYSTAQAMTHSVQTGKPAFEHVFGERLFDYLAHNHAQDVIFNRLMSQSLSDRIAGIVGAYDFGRAKTIVDIGGGHGAMLAAILAVAPDARGIVFDRPDVIAEARVSLAQSSIARRIDLVGGDLFDGPLPPSGDLYLLSNIIHDWDDPAAEQILNNCRAATKPASRLLLIEDIMPAWVATAPATIANDYSMLLLTGGRQRTKSELRELLAATGFQLTSLVRPGLGKTSTTRTENWAIIECKPRRL